MKEVSDKNQMVWLAIVFPVSPWRDEGTDDSIAQGSPGLTNMQLSAQQPPPAADLALFSAPNPKQQP